MSTGMSRIGVGLAMVACGILFGSVQATAGEPKKPKQKPVQAQANQQAEGPAHKHKGGHLAELPLPPPTAIEVAGKKGWKIAIPGHRPLATPAVHDGVLFVGGGFGSHEFYAINAATGKLVWGFQTDDDGPTAAVVSDGCVAYNTESCTIYVHDLADGKLLWSKWLGDPLMSQPAIDAGKLYMAYPGSDHSHHLICLSLRTGEKVWDEKIQGDVITAPVVKGEHVYCACLEGTVFKFDKADGKLIWSEQRHATSAPYIDGEKVYVSQATDEAPAADKEGDDAAATALAKEVHLRGEGLYAFSAEDGKQDVLTNAAPVAAPFLDDAQTLRGKAGAGKQHVAKLKSELGKAEQSARAGNSGAKQRADKLSRDVAQADKVSNSIEQSADAAEKELKDEKLQDASVAFSANPAAAKINQAKANIGKGSVQGNWSFQGSRALVRGPQSYIVQGDLYRCVDNATGEVVWQQKMSSKANATRAVTPPSEAGGKHYFGTADGEIVCRDMRDGKLLWNAAIGGGAIIFQPAVMDGRVIAGTQQGTLLVLDVGDPKATGWAMWGGNAAHDGSPAVGK